MTGKASDYLDERTVLAEAGRYLLERGLVARTWGNLSIRVDEEHFLITPSGRNYETLGPDDMALVSLRNLSWSGTMKPSSEKELHARIYRDRDDAGAVIHTHQPAASSLAAARRGFSPSLTSGDSARVGESVPCVPYALPTTSALAKSVEQVLQVTGPDTRALLLSNHGAVCIGADMAETLKLAVNLERASEYQVLKGFRTMTNQPAATRDDILSYSGTAVSAGSGIASADPAFGHKIGDDLLSYLKKKSPRKHFLIAESPFARCAADRGHTIRPMLDDLAQLIGPTLPVVDLTRRGAFRKIRRILTRSDFWRRSAVLLPGIGCLCTADTGDDVLAVSMVAEKGCRVSIESAYLGGGHTIGLLDSLLMRLIYLLKYSRKAN